jgi:hypothetical protein
LEKIKHFTEFELVANGVRITGTWRNSFADKDQKGRDLQKFDRVEELICGAVYFVDASFTFKLLQKNQIQSSLTTIRNL